MFFRLASRADLFPHRHGPVRGIAAGGESQSTIVRIVDEIVEQVLIQRHPPPLFMKVNCDPSSSLIQGTLSAASSSGPTGPAPVSTGRCGFFQRMNRVTQR